LLNTLDIFQSGLRRRSTSGRRRPTMIVGFTRYSRDRSFVVLGENRVFVLAMAAG